VRQLGNEKLRDAKGSNPEVRKIKVSYSNEKFWYADDLYRNINDL